MQNTWNFLFENLRCGQNRLPHFFDCGGQTVRNRKNARDRQDICCSETLWLCVNLRCGQNDNRWRSYLGVSRCGRVVGRWMRRSELTGPDKKRKKSKRRKFCKCTVYNGKNTKNPGPLLGSGQESGRLCELFKEIECTSEGEQPRVELL